jgi:hypothetical protein
MCQSSNSSASKSAIRTAHGGRLQVFAEVEAQLKGGEEVKAKLAKAMADRAQYEGQLHSLQEELAQMQVRTVVCRSTGCALQGFHCKN